MKLREAWARRINQVLYTRIDVFLSLAVVVVPALVVVAAVEVESKIV